MSDTQKMRSVNLGKNKKKNSSWVLATLLMENYLRSQAKIDRLYNETINSLEIEKRRFCKFLFYGAVRNKLRIDDALSQSIRKQPKELLLSILYISGYELLVSNQEKAGSIIHYAVEEAKSLVSHKEVQFINAVLRKLPKQFSQQTPSKSLAIYYSHPHWLVDRWIEHFGRTNTEALLKWNQAVPEIHLLAKNISDTQKKAFDLRAFKSSSASHGNTFKDLYTLSEASLQNQQLKGLLSRGGAYIKDPSTLYAVEALNPKPHESVLDLCAAPGGKTFDCIQRMGESGILVAVDYKEARMERLKQNLKPFMSSSLQLALIDCDILKLNDSQFIDRGLPILYDAILLDAPCSNTGVIQRRPDARWRIYAKTIEKSASLQLDLLKVASSRLKDGGRLVYSTCSIDSLENEVVVKKFLATKAGQRFILDTQSCFYPWKDGHDGAGVFRMIKKSNGY